MKTALINASPRLLMKKKETSNTAAVLQDFRGILRHEHQHNIEEIHIKTGNLSESQMEVLGSCPVWVIAFPVYMGGLPAHLLEWLMQVEEVSAKASPGEIKIYAIGIGSLYEGSCASSALHSLRIWCRRCSFSWCGGLGIGGGAYYWEHSMERFLFGRGRTGMRRLTTFGAACAKGVPILNMTCSPDCSVSRYVLNYNRNCKKEAKEFGLTSLDMNRQN